MDRREPSRRHGVGGWCEERVAARSHPARAQQRRGLEGRHRRAEGRGVGPGVGRYRGTAGSERTTARARPPHGYTQDARAWPSASLSVSPDGCCVSFLRHNPGIPGQSVASYFERADQTGNADAAYTAVNWGTERHTIDGKSGAAIAAPAASVPQSAASVEIPSARPGPTRGSCRWHQREMRRSISHEVPTGTHLWLSGGGGRPLTASQQVWRANAWMSELRLGRAERVGSTGAGGAPLNAWVLLPPNHVAGTRAPLVTIVYPTAVYGATAPSSFSAFQPNFEHPQLFAALGYAVLLPSMPALEDPLESHALNYLVPSVLPAVDAAIARGLARTAIKLPSPARATAVSRRSGSSPRPRDFAQPSPARRLFESRELVQAL